MGLRDWFRGSKDTYDAGESSNRRKSPGGGVKREDRVLQQAARTRVQVNANDLARNYSIASWMIRRHLDYVATHEFIATTGDKGLDNDLKQWMEAISRPEYMDAGRRCTREKYFRLCEARRCLDGDTGTLLIRDGTVEGIESDRIRDPEDTNIKSRGTWIQGVRTGAGGRHLEYSLFNRGGDGNGYEFSRTEPWTRVLMHGFYDRYASDQIRGISPIVSALDPLRDVYEARTYALAKAKVSQLFALAFYKQDSDSVGDVTEQEGTSDENDSGGPRYAVDFGRGPAILDLDPGDRAEFLESKTPSTEFVQFLQTTIMVGMKALDLPYSFYDESHTNFFGSRGAWLHYERACLDKRRDQQELRRRWTLWRMQLGIQDGDFTLPSGWRLRDLKFRWIPLGMPWWKPTEEINGTLAAIGGGLDCPQEACLRTGTEYESNVRKTCEAIKLARDLGQEIIGEPLQLQFLPQQAAKMSTKKVRANQK